MSAVEGNHRAKGKKVTALVPRVENRIENAAAHGVCRMLQPSIHQPHLKRRADRGFHPYFWRGIDFIPRVGYAYRTFAVRPLNDDWEK